MSKVSHVVFDVGGVLLDWRNALTRVTSKLNVAEDELHSLLQEYLADLELGNITDDIIWKAAVDKFNPSENYLDVSNVWIKEQPRIEPAWDLAKKLKAEGFVLGVCTNNWLGVMENIIKENPDFSIFDDIIDSSQEKLKKPGTEIYKLVEKRLGTRGDSIYFIDDSERNVVAARTLGWNGYIYSGREFEEMNEEILAELGLG